MHVGSCKFSQNNVPKTRNTAILMSALLHRNNYFAFIFIWARKENGINKTFPVFISDWTWTLALARYFYSLALTSWNSNILFLAIFFCWFFPQVRGTCTRFSSTYICTTTATHYIQGSSNPSYVIIMKSSVHHYRHYRQSWWRQTRLKQQHPRGKNNIANKSEWNHERISFPKSPQRLIITPYSHPSISQTSTHTLILPYVPIFCPGEKKRKGRD